MVVILYFCNLHFLRKKLTKLLSIIFCQNASIFDKIQLKKNEKMDVFVNGKDLTYNDDVKTVNIRVFSDNIILEYFNGITFAIKANKNYNALLVVVTVSNEYKSKTRGLLGNMDDNELNEFTIPSGTVLSLNSFDDKALYS